jgi:hypothetical protein
MMVLTFLWKGDMVRSPNGHESNFNGARTSRSTPSPSSVHAPGLRRHGYIIALDPRFPQNLQAAANGLQA